MNKYTWTVIVGAVAAALPGFTGALPPDWAAALTGVIAAAGSIYHLLQPAPGSK